MIVKPMQPKDLQYVLRNPIDADAGSLGDVTIEGEAHAAWYDGQVVGVGGVKAMWPGVGEAWVLFSKDVRNCRFGIYRATKRILSQYDSYQRIQASARVDAPIAAKMLEKLGFEMEGKMRKYSIDGTDHYMYAKVK